MTPERVAPPPAKVLTAMRRRSTRYCAKVDVEVAELAMALRRLDEGISAAEQDYPERFDKQMSAFRAMHEAGEAYLSAVTVPLLLFTGAQRAALDDGSFFDLAGNGTFQLMALKAEKASIEPFLELLTTRDVAVPHLARLKERREMDRSTALKSIESAVGGLSFCAQELQYFLVQTESRFFRKVEARAKVFPNANARRVAAHRERRKAGIVYTAKVPVHEHDMSTLKDMGFLSGEESQADVEDALRHFVDFCLLEFGPAPKRASQAATDLAKRKGEN